MKDTNSELGDLEGSLNVFNESQDLISHLKPTTVCPSPEETAVQSVDEIVNDEEESQSICVSREGKRK